MFLLPKGTPLFENLAASKIKLPEVMAKLSTGAFTGYANFVFQTTTYIMVFESGKLVSVLQEDKNDNRLTGFDAMSALAEHIITSGSGALNVYKLSKDLTMCIHALIQGEILYKAQELKLIDIKTLLEKIKEDQMNGCLRIYTQDRSAMIFYKSGTPLGFFHDGSHDIETSSSESQKIAGLPGAKIDLFSTQSVEELMGMDLLEVFNVQNIWDTCAARHAQEIDRLNSDREDKERKAQTIRLVELESQVQAIVTEYVGKVGRGIVDKELGDQGGNACLIDEAGAAKFMAGVERAAKLLISSTNIKLMQEKLSALLTQARS